jgi:hypothetical protein
MWLCKELIHKLTHTHSPGSMPVMLRRRLLDACRYRNAKWYAEATPQLMVSLWWGTSTATLFQVLIGTRQCLSIARISASPQSMTLLALKTPAQQRRGRIDIWLSDGVCLAHSQGVSTGVDAHTAHVVYS